MDKKAKLAAWRESQRVKPTAAPAEVIAPAPPPPAPAPAQNAPTPPTTVSVGLKLGKKKPIGLKKAIKKPPISSFASNSDSDHDDAPNSDKTLPTFDSDDDQPPSKKTKKAPAKNTSKAAPVEDDELDMFMKSTINSSKELVAEDTTVDLAGIVFTSVKKSAPTITADQPKTISADDLKAMTAQAADAMDVVEEEEESEGGDLLKALLGAHGHSTIKQPKSDDAAQTIDELKKLAKVALLATRATPDLGRLENSEGDLMDESERLLDIYQNDSARKLDSAMETINKKKNIEAVDHDLIDYLPITKNLYIPPEHLHPDKYPKATLAATRSSLGLKIRGAGNIPVPITDFADAGLSTRVLEIVKTKLGITTPFPIQQQCLPLLMSGRDTIGIAKTGSGKTLAYLLPMIRHIQDQPPLELGESGPIGLIFAPARELATQIHSVMQRFAKYTNIRSTCIYGGGGVAEQIGDLKRGASVVVATPGRLIDVMTMGHGKIITLERCSYVVLDEADRMFDMGFAPQIASILAAVRPDRQLSLFSATFPKSVEDLARKSLRFPVEVIVGGRSVASDTIDQHAEVISDEAKFYRLLQLLGIWVDKGKVIVFCDTQTNTDNLFTILSRHGYPCLSLHGGKEQDEREETLQEFRDTDSTFRVLIATSVAGRGLDVPSCRLVVNYNAPNHLEDYVHRVGRTGRAGRAGTAHTFINPENEAQFAPVLIKCLTDGGWEKNISQELRDLSEIFNKKVEAGEAFAANRGYGGRGFTYDNDEMNDKQKLQKAEKKQEMIDAGMIAEDDDNDDAGAAEEPVKDAAFLTKEASISPKGAAAATAAGEASISSGAKNGSSNPKKTGGPGVSIDLGGVHKDAISKAQAIAAKIGLGSAAAAVAMGELGENAVQHTSMRHGQLLTHYTEEIEINDYPREARWRVTQKDTVARLADTYAIAITNRGEFYPPGKVPNAAKGEKKMCISVEATDPVNLKNCLAEIKRLMVEETTRLAGGGGGQRSGKFKM